MKNDTEKSINKNISAWENSLKETKSFSLADIEELKNHLLDDIENLELNGLSKKEAIRIALKRIGKTTILKTEYEKINQWYKVSNILKPYFIGILIFMIYSTASKSIQFLLISETSSARLFLPQNNNLLLENHLMTNTLIGIGISSLIILLIWKFRDIQFWRNLKFILNPPITILLFILVIFIPVQMSSYLLKLNGNQMQMNKEDVIYLNFINYNIDTFQYSMIVLIIILISFSYYKYKKSCPQIP